MADTSRPRWTDDHCHLPAEDWESVIADALAAGVERFVDVGVDVETSRDAIARASVTEGVWATAGVHPHEAKDGIAGLETLLRRVAAATPPQPSARSPGFFGAPGSELKA